MALVRASAAFRLLLSSPPTTTAAAAPALSVPLHLPRLLPSWPRPSSIQPALAVSAPPSVISLPGLLADLWDSVLRAVPKKKTSHMKKRHRQYAGKALKDLTELNKCSGCGRVKRAHVLCPYCVASIKDFWKTGSKPKESEA
ncbi:hypothetical protein BDY21DRAFT_368566 [Lineolata rhizophorae]|uniref:Large ribosomal subunit protein bL32m n=1 Tax=Lineolata rhizophorae TaxID=578093 RepID=A0A6A6PBT0_9PEZI|nr:hypothetical protein BDY21DRAFT_368566 [Lineolata rhizophorae]